MCVRICKCLQCGRKKRCRNCSWMGTALARMSKSGVDIAASVMCVKGDGVQDCPGFTKKGGTKN